VNLQQNPLRTFVVSFFTSKLKQIIPPHFHHSYMLSYDNIDYIRDAIGLENKYVGYLYLVDWNGRIRWAGCGGPWVGDGDGSAASGGTSNATSSDSAALVPTDFALDSTSTSTSKQPLEPKGKSLPEGGPGGQVMEGVVQGLSEMQRLERCLDVLMKRLDSEGNSKVKVKGSGSV
jgi:ATPase complex subunit ATP10